MSCQQSEGKATSADTRGDILSALKLYFSLIVVGNLLNDFIPHAFINVRHVQSRIISILHCPSLFELAVKLPRTFFTKKKNPFTLFIKLFTYLMTHRQAYKFMAVFFSNLPK